MIRFLVCIVLLLQAHEVLAQRPDAFFQEGQKAKEVGEWPKAFAFFEQAFLLDSGNFEFTTHWAEAAEQIKDYPLAQRLYTKAYEKDEGKLYPEGLFRIAMLEKMSGDYESALRDFKKYVRKHSKNKKSELHKRALAEIESCTWVLAYKDKEQLDPVPLKMPPSEAVDSRNVSFVTNDTLFWSRSQPATNTWAVYRSAVKNDAVEVVDSLSNPNEYSVSNVCLGENGYAYFSFVENGRSHIRKTVLPGFDFSKSEKLNAISEEGSNSTQPWIAQINGTDYLFFVSDRKGGFGGNDIWIARASNGVFVNPENAGDVVNTAANEVSPFFKEGKLYFSSELHKGFGGLDVFLSEGMPGNWGTPNNAGKGINSSMNDLFYREQGDSLVYFSSNRTLPGEPFQCCNQIFVLKKEEKEKNITQLVAESKGNFKSLEELNAVLPVTLYFHNDEPNPRSLDTTTAFTYSQTYINYLELKKEYVEKSAEKSSISIEDLTSEIDDFFALKVEKGYNDLDVFCKLLRVELEKGVSVEVAIRGFASPRAKSDYNKRLTQRRIRSLINELNAREDGFFTPYIQGTASGVKLSFIELPFGEEKSAAVSDDLKNTKESVYSRGARLERKIEIVGSSGYIVPADTMPALELPETYHDFGKVDPFTVVYKEFRVINRSDRELIIDSTIASCGCTEPVMSMSKIPPKGEAILKVGFNPFGGKGRETKQIMVYPLGEKPREIIIEAEIVKRK